MYGPAVAVLAKSDGTVIAAQIALAETPLRRMKGLLGRRELSPGEGMLFRPAGSIHMFFMRIGLDVVFCDADLRVVRVVRGLRPWRIAGARGAKVAIELGAGGAAGVEPGDRLQLVQ